jgi:hypothetical protein
VALVPLPLSGQKPHSSQIVLRSRVGDTTLARQVTEDKNAKIDRAGVIQRDACRKRTSGYFLPTKMSEMNLNTNNPIT